MLDFLREGARTWIAKLLMGLLVLSFGVWGISGSIFNNLGDSVVTVGDTNVTPTEFLLAYDRQLNVLSQQFGTRLTTEQARAFGVEAQVYGQLIAGAALDQQAKDMKLGLSKDRLAELIANDPAFQGINGQFSRQNFSAVLRNVGMSEADYIENRGQVAVRTQIVEAASDGFAAPDTLLAAIVEFQNESRDIDYILLDKSHADPVGAPDESVLSTYFEDNKASYAAPEYREIVYVRLLAQDILDPSVISDETVADEYDRTKSRYETAEQRTLDQLVFDDSAAADAARASLDAGKTFDDLVAEQGKTATDVRLGSFTRTNVPDQSLADAAFAVAEAGGVSDVAQGLFGPVILRVAEITPGSVRPLSEVADEIRSELALVEANQVLLDVHDAYEDSRASGETLEDAARKQRLTPTTIAAVDRTGQNPDGEVITDIPASRQLLADAFEAGIDVETPPINIGADGFVWFEVRGVEAARDRELTEVRDQVIADWTRSQEAIAVGAKATEIKDRVEAGETLATIAEELALPLENKFALKRASDDSVLGRAAVTTAFSGPSGTVAVANAADDGTQVVLQVTQTQASAISGADALGEQDRATITQRAADEILDQLVVRLQSQYDVSVNQALAQQTLAYPGGGGGHQGM